MSLSERISRHLRAHIVGYVALFVALSGTAVALPGKKSVKSNDIAPNAVRTKAIKAGAVKNSKLADGAVTSAKIADGQGVGVDLANSSITEPKLANDAVSRRTIVAGSINGGKLANGSVNSQKVDNGSLLAEDFAPGQLGDAFVATGGDFTLARSGEVFVTASFLSSCTATCADTYTVNVDGTPVPGATFTRAGDDDLHITLTGVTPSLTAAPHTFTLAATPGGATESAQTFVGIQLQ